MSEPKEPIIWQCEHCGAFNNIENKTYYFKRNNIQEKWNRIKMLIKNLHLDLIKSSYR